MRIYPCDLTKLYFLIWLFSFLLGALAKWPIFRWCFSNSLWIVSEKEGKWNENIRIWEGISRMLLLEPRELHQKSMKSFYYSALIHVACESRCHLSKAASRRHFHACFGQKRRGTGKEWSTWSSYCAVLPVPSCTYFGKTEFIDCYVDFTRCLITARAAKGCRGSSLPILITFGVRH